MSGGGVGAGGGGGGGGGVGVGDGNNVQVVVRCRPPTDAERRGGDVGVIGCLHGSEVHVLAGSGKAKAALGCGGKKVYTFDQSYGATSSQEEVYHRAVRPLVEEVLAGFNCTVFAYGQTGTGKTYTMEGELTSNVASKHAGVIPRSVHTIFDVLENQSLEYSVKVSFLELYNEELTDLLAEEEGGVGGGSAPSAGMVDDGGGHKELRIFEDTTGKRGMLVNNLEEVIVTSSAEVFALLQRSWQKRRTAETLLNKNSSRSHCVFIITVHTKECDDEGEDIIKTGKLYLVDLAGSECVGKSGAQNQRAKEAGKINQSLLTLGRVINALVDKASYVPYRDSKLTRLLQESLGGRAKTVIIATVSPSLLALDETLSTLEYAHRAKNIRNRPQVNQKMSKRAYMKDLLAEISSLKRDNEALRLKNGIFLPPDKYELMVSQQRGDSLRLEELYFAVKSKEQEMEQLQHTLQEREAQVTQVTAEKLHTQAALQLTQDALSTAELQLQSTQAQLQTTTGTLKETSQQLAEEQVKVEEGAVLLQAHQRTEEALTAQAVQLVQVVECALGEKERLLDKVQRKAEVEVSNGREVERLTERVGQQSRLFDDSTRSFSSSFSAQQRRTQAGVLRVEQGSRESAAAVHAEVSQWGAAWRVQAEELQLKQGAYHEATQRHLQLHSAEVEEAHGRLLSAIGGADEGAQQGSARVQRRLHSQAAHVEQALQGRGRELTAQRQSTSTFARSSSAALLLLSDSTTAGLQCSVDSLHSSLAFLSSFLQAQDEQRQRLRSSLLSSVHRLLEDAEEQQKRAMHSAVQELSEQLRAQEQRETQLSQGLAEDNRAVQSDVRGWCEERQRAIEGEEAELQSAAVEWRLLADSAASEVTQLSSQLSAALSDAQGQCSAEAERGRQRGAEWSGSLSSFHADAAQHSAHLQQLHHSFTSNLSASVQLSSRVQQAELAEVSGGLDALQSSVSGYVDCALQHSSSVHSAVQRFQSADFRVDQPTGRTPEKRKMPYPTPAALTATPPHPQLLQAFRANKKKRTSHRHSAATHGHPAQDAGADGDGERLSPGAAIDGAAPPSASPTPASTPRQSAGQSQSPPLPLPSHMRHASASASAHSAPSSSLARDASSGLPPASSAIPVLSLRSASSRNSATAAHSSATALVTSLSSLSSENTPPAPPSTSMESSKVSAAAAASSFIPAPSKPTLRSASRLRFGPAQSQQGAAQQQPEPMHDQSAPA